MADSNHELTIFDLPQEDIIFDKIFRHLFLDEIYKCRRVCKAFKGLCSQFFNNCTTMNINNVSQHPSNMKCDVLECLTRDNRSLHTLILRNPKFILEDSVVIDILRRNPNLQKLDLSGCRMLTSVVILKLASFCTKLRELVLYDCVWVSPKALIEVFTGCTELEIIDLTRCFRINLDCVTSLSQNCTRLRYVRLNQFIGLLDQDLDEIASNCPHLTHVGIGGCVLLTDSSLNTLVAKCPNLRHVEVNSCNSMTKNGLQFLWDHGIETDVKKEFVERSKFWS